MGMRATGHRGAARGSIPGRAAQSTIERGLGVAADAKHPILPKARELGYFATAKAHQRQGYATEIFAIAGRG